MRGGDGLVTAMPDKRRTTIIEHARICDTMPMDLPIGGKCTFTGGFKPVRKLGGKQ